MRYFWVPGIVSGRDACDALCRRHTLTVTLCDSRYNVISPVPGVDHGDFWALLCLPATAVKEGGEKKDA